MGLRFTQLCCQLVVLKFIPPDLIGVWQFAIVVNTYLLFSQLGIVGAMNREYPYFMGKGDTAMAKDIVHTARAYNLANSVIVGLVFVIGAFVVVNRGQQWYSTFMTMAIVAPLQLYTGYLEGTYRSADVFGALSRRKIMLIPVHVASIALPWKLGFNGFLIRELFVAGFCALICHLSRPIRVRPIFHFGVFKVLFSTGWRLFVRNYLSKVAFSFPRLALVSLGGVASLGLFTPVSWMFTGISGIAASFGAYLYPKLTYRYAKGDIPIGKIAIRASLAAMLLLLPCVVLGLCFLPWLMHTLMPQYAPAVRAAQVTLVASLLECMSVATVVFAAVKAWRAMFTYVICMLVFRFAGAWCGYYAMKDPLLGVACGMLATSIVMCPVTWFTVRLASRRCVLATSEAE